MNSSVPADTAAVPSPFLLKPIFAVDEGALSAKGCNTNGTSFACAYLAGAFARGVLEGRVRRCRRSLEQQAELATHCETRRLSGPRVADIAWMPVHALEIVRNPKNGNPESRNLAVLLCQELSKKLCEDQQQSDIDVVAYGSFVTMATWIGIHTRSPESLKPTSDIDLLVGDIAEGTSRSTTAACEAIARDWLKSELGPAWSQALKVDNHALRGRMCGGEYLRGLIPAASIFATASGLLDPFGGVDELRTGEISLHLPASWTLLPGVTSAEADVIMCEVALRWVSLVLGLQAQRRGICDSGTGQVNFDKSSLAALFERLGNRQSWSELPRDGSVSRTLTRLCTRLQRAESACAEGPDPIADRIISLVRERRTS